MHCRFRGLALEGAVKLRHEAWLLEILSQRKCRVLRVFYIVRIGWAASVFVIFGV